MFRRRKVIEPKRFLPSMFLRSHTFNLIIVVFFNLDLFHNNRGIDKIITLCSAYSSARDQSSLRSIHSFLQPP